MELERCFTLTATSELTGYSVAALRKKALTRQIGYRRSARLILIPESEVRKLQGDLRPAITAGSGGGK
jgi:hypothetical protein